MTYTPDDVNRLYSSIGEAIWHLQHLENVMTTFNALTILQKRREKGAKISETEADEVLEKQRKLTLGPLIGAAKRNQTLPQNMVERFDSFLLERNWLIHKCVINEYLSLKNAVSKEKLFQRISKFIQEGLALKQTIFNLMESWYQKKGYDLEEAYLDAEILLEKSKYNS